MNYFTVISLLIATTVLADNNDNTKFPLCKLCTCQMINSEQQADVVCKINQPTIFHRDYWVNATNSSYAYNSITLENFKFYNLTDIFLPSNLTYLSLANSNIYGIADNVFRNLQGMKTLILSYNDMEIIHVHAFKGMYMEGKLMPLKALKVLKLDHNKLHTLNQDLFEHTTDIEVLDLSNNPLETIDQHTASAICSLSLLKELYLQYTAITTLPDNMLHTPKYLQVLDLSGNPIEIFPGTLKQAKSLTHLYLNNTGFTNLTEENGFPELPKLKVLHLCRNEHLSHLKKHSLSGLTGLEVLRLSHNIDLTVIDPLALAKPMNNSGGSIWPPIRELWIANNKLAYLDSDILARWDSLTGLDIRYNAWTCECENQWLIDDLMPIYLRIDPKTAKIVMCEAPIEMEHASFYELYIKKSQMRCLDIYGAHPENDAIMLVGVLAGVLIAIPTVLFIIFAYQRRWISFCGIFDSSPAAYSRRYYKAGSTDDNL